MPAKGSAARAWREAESARTAQARAPRQGRQQMSDGRDWFAQKRYGYGAGLPISWQGWALLIGYIALVVAAGFLIPRTVGVYISIVTILPPALIVIAARTTQGGWRWRWGDPD